MSEPVLRYAACALQSGQRLGARSASSSLRPALAAEPAGVADEPAVVGHRGFLFRVQDAEKVIGLRERELGVAECGHGRERGGFFAGERTDGFVAVEKRIEMIEVDRHIVRVRGIVDESEPLDDVALDGVGDIVHGVGAVGEAEVDDGRGVRNVRVRAASLQKRLEACRSLWVQSGASAGRSGASSA